MLVVWPHREVESERSPLASGRRAPSLVEDLGMEVKCRSRVGGHILRVEMRDS